MVQCKIFCPSMILAVNQRQKAIVGRVRAKQMQAYRTAHRKAILAVWRCAKILHRKISQAAINEMLVHMLRAIRAWNYRPMQAQPIRHRKSVRARRRSVKFTLIARQWRPVSSLFKDLSKLKCEWKGCVAHRLPVLKITFFERIHYFPLVFRSTRNKVAIPFLRATIYQLFFSTSFSNWIHFLTRDLLFFAFSTLFLLWNK